MTRKLSTKRPEKKRPARDSVASNREQAHKWGRRLAKSVSNVLEQFPNADADNVRHTLILLEKPPLERLQRSLLRSRANPKRR
jgi:hypothetical protein